MLTACNQQEESFNSEGELFKLDITAESYVNTRSDANPVAPEIPEGYELRYILEIYNNDVLYQRMVQNDGSMNFRLITNQPYEFLVWVDYVEKNTSNADLNYTASSLKSIEMKSDITNNDVTRDAFFYAFRKSAIEIGNQANNFGTVICRRPFGQLNITTTDWNEINGVAALTPDKVDIKYVAYTKFNVSTGDVTDAQELTYDPSADFAGDIIDATKRHLTCDYIFAPTVINDEKYIIPTTLVTFYNGDNEITNTGSMLVSLPIKRNFKTNVSGKLLSKAGEVNIVVDSEWDGTNDVTIAD